MREELDNYLCTTYPKMFVNRNKSPQETCMCWGFAHGDGWFNILNQLCANIQHHIDWSVKNNQWDIENDKENVRPICEQVVVEQVKEKFGTLRFYYQGGDEYISGLVRMAESMTGVMCEECGAPATTRSGGWVRTLCDKHEEEHQTMLKERYGDET